MDDTSFLQDSVNGDGSNFSRSPSVNGNIPPSVSAGSNVDSIFRESEHPMLLPSISPSREDDTSMPPSKTSELPSIAPSLGGSVDVSLGTLVPTAKTIAQTRRRRRRRRSRHQRQRKRIARNERQHIRALMDNEITNDPVKHETLSSKQ
jgi:hypothetical protein